MPSDACTIEIVRDLASFHQLRSAWEDLWATTERQSIFTSFAWTQATLETHWNDNPQYKLFCFVKRKRQEVVFIWPFVIRSQHGCRIAVPISAVRGTYSDLIPDASVSQITEAWQIIRRTIRADMINFPEVRERSPLNTVLKSIPGVTVVETDVAPYLRPGDFASWQEYVQLRTNAKMRSDARRLERRLTEHHGPIRYETATTVTRATELIVWLVQQKRVWLTNMNLLNETYIMTDDFIEFLTKVMHATLSHGQCIVEAMHAGDHILAADIRFHSGRYCEGFQSAFDEAFAVFRPGQSLRMHMMECEFMRNDIIDLLNGNSNQKRQLTDTVEPLTYYRCAVSWVGYCRLFATRWKLRQSNVGLE